MQNMIYIRLKKYAYLNNAEALKVRDVAYMTGPEQLVHACSDLSIHHKKVDKDKTYVLEAFFIVKIIQQHLPNVDVQITGPNNCILQKKERIKKTNIIFVIFVWILLFIGSAMAIMNFHYDVSMQSVQQRLHFLLTGENVEYPLWLQVPYSIGLGLGMILFFNYLFKKRLNDEPSPMEIELYKYQQDIDQYVQYYENPLNNDDHDQS